MAWHHPGGNGAEPSDHDTRPVPGTQTMVSDSTLVVLPTYQEVDNIPVLIRGLRAELPLATILVIDDGSPDGTADAVEALSGDDPRIVLQRRPGKLGLGTAHRLGFEYAMHHGFRTVVTMDADLSHRPVDAPRLVARSREPGVDVAVGSRYVAGGRIEGWPASRRALSFCANMLLRLSLRAPIHDCTGAFRAYDVEFMRTLPLDELENPGYSSIPEQLLLAMQQGGTLVEEPITFVERQMGATKLTKRELGSSLLNVVHMYRRRRRAAARARELQLAGRPARAHNEAHAAATADVPGSRRGDTRSTGSAAAPAAADRAGHARP